MLRKSAAAQQATPEYIPQKYFALRPERQLNHVRAGSSLPAEHRLRLNPQCSSQGWAFSFPIPRRSSQALALGLFHVKPAAATQSMPDRKPEA